MSPGMKTSEFAVTVATTVLAFALVLFRVPKVESDNFMNAVAQAIPVVGAVVAQGFVVWKYISGRNELKKLEAGKESAQ